MSNAFGKIEKVTVSGFEFRKFGSLRQVEIEWFDKQSNLRLASLLPIYELAQRVSKELEIPDTAALAAIQGEGDPEQYSKVMLTYAKELLAVKDQAYTETDFQNAVCTMMLQNRVSKSFLANNTESINEFFEVVIDPANPEWKAEYSKNLPLSTIAEIIEFTTNERTEWVNEPVLEGSEDVPVSLGK